jgi:hypothetical protein
MGLPIVSNWHLPELINLIIYITIFSILSNLGLYNDDTVSKNDKTVFVIVFTILTLILMNILYRLTSKGNFTFAWLLLFMYLTLLSVVIYSLRIVLYLTYGTKGNLKEITGKN